MPELPRRTSPLRVALQNIVADYGPADGPLIIIGAHYDSASSYENDQLTYTPGADDNASGVAGLLELARLFTSASTENRRAAGRLCVGRTALLS